MSRAADGMALVPTWATAVGLALAVAGAGGGRALTPGGRWRRPSWEPWSSVPGAAVAALLVGFFVSGSSLTAWRRRVRGAVRARGHRRAGTPARCWPTAASPPWPRLRGSWP
ncbi:hypothetical protein [Geochorda subterranea]|uniref:Uncharacterized protein n=1 Tax=Geochorda subterranea TaxID=3109564 RepID=A0ABZ1BRL4_9FIRM|nr:hypothetical protein [Limnochorda sp. LNt]WRP15422.1 hypothetical protein VLY81_04450 [Limnochorda sp. LNt]